MTTKDYKTATVNSRHRPDNRSRMQQIQIDSLLSNGWKIFDNNGGYVYLLRTTPLHADKTERLRVNSFGFISESDY